MFFFRPKAKERRVALLVTEDDAVESAVRANAPVIADEIKHVRDAREAMGDVIGGCDEEAVAIVDLETKPCGRRLVETASSAVPVIAITSKPCSWLESMLRRHRIAAALVKPVDMQKLTEALRRVRELRGREGRAWW